MYVISTFHAHRQGFPRVGHCQPRYVGASRCFLGSQVLDGESRYQLATRGLPAGGGTLASQMRGVMPRLIAQNDPHPGRLTQTHYSSIRPGALLWTTVRATSSDKVPVNHFPITHAELTQI